MKLSPAERLIITMLSETQIALNGEFSIDPLAVRDAIAYDQLWALDFLTDFDEQNHDIPEVVLETCQILEMWSNIESSIRNMNHSEKSKLISDVGIENCSFKGFYPNQSEHHIISMILIQRLKRFSEFSGRRMASSDSLSIDRYRDMMRFMNEKKLFFPLNGDDLKCVLLYNISKDVIFTSNLRSAPDNDSKLTALSDIEWTLIASMLPRKSRGVARVDDRLVFDAVLWRFRSGRSWRSLPDQFGSFKTAYNRLKRWKNSGLWQKVVAAIHRLHGPDLVLIDEDGNRATVRDSDQILDRYVAWEVPLSAENERRTKPSRHVEVRKVRKSRPQRTTEVYEDSIGLSGGTLPASATLESGTLAVRVEEIQHTAGDHAQISIDQRIHSCQHEGENSIQADSEHDITAVNSR
ncbi:YfbU family protein [Xanthobacter wiegelii]|uniref:YfbU family protein n=1 Tax=Xanthobacter wiegelii TaxID=3119913 RepID=UPI003726A64C